MLTASDAALMGWLGFVGFALATFTLVPLVGWLIRSRLPERRDSRRSLLPSVAALRLGRSPKTRRSPRQAISAHRTLLTATSMAAMSLVLIPLVAALSTLDLSGFLVALGFALPSLIVVLHSRRRDVTGKSGV